MKRFCCLAFLLLPGLVWAQVRNTFTMQNDTTKLRDSYISGTNTQDKSRLDNVGDSGWIGSLSAVGEARFIVYWAFDDSLNALTYKYVKSATLSLWQNSSSGTAPDSAGIRMIIKANQLARTGADTAWVAWVYTTVSDSSKWTSFGAMGVGDVMTAQLDIATGLRANWGSTGRVNFNVTEAVKSVANGTAANKGFIIYVLPTTWPFTGTNRGSFKSEPTAVANGPMIRIEFYGEVATRAQGLVLADARGFNRVPGRNRGKVITSARRIF
mgnify:CR=1 FL=1